MGRGEIAKCAEDRRGLIHKLADEPNSEGKFAEAEAHIYIVTFSDGCRYRGDGLTCAMRRENAIALAEEFHRLDIRYGPNKGAKIISVTEFDMPYLG